MTKNTVVRVVGDVGSERIHKKKKVQRIKFLIYSPRGKRALVWRDTPVMRGRGFEL